MTYPLSAVYVSIYLVLLLLAAKDAFQALTTILPRSAAYGRATGISMWAALFGIILLINQGVRARSAEKAALRKMQPPNPAPEPPLK